MRLTLIGLSTLKSDALRAAYSERVVLLFKNLCDGHADQAAQARFDDGLKIATAMLHRSLAEIDDAETS